MVEARKIGVHIGSGNLAMAAYRVIGQFATSEVIRLNDHGSTHSALPAVVYLSGVSKPEIGRAAKLKWARQAERLYSPLGLVAAGQTSLTVDDHELDVQELLGLLVAGLKDQAGMFGDFARCSVAYPDYLSPAQLAAFKKAVLVEIPDLEESNFIPSGLAALFDMQLHQMRYGKAYHQFDFQNSTKVAVVDIGENFTTASLFEIRAEDGAWSAHYLTKPYWGKVGGRDFDTTFADYLVEQARANGLLSEGELTPELRRQIQLEAERLKCELSDQIDAQVNSTNLPPDAFNDLAVPLTVYGPAGKKLIDTSIDKKTYDKVVLPAVVAATGKPCVMQVLTEALDAAGESLANLDEIVLVGGMARLHLIGQVLNRVWGKPLRELRNPEFSAARGAAIYHDMVSHNE